MSLNKEVVDTMSLAQHNADETTYQSDYSSKSLQKSQLIAVEPQTKSNESNLSSKLFVPIEGKSYIKEKEYHPTTINEKLETPNERNKRE